MSLFLSTLPAWAAETEGAAAGGDGGLPQFDPSWYPEQIFWLVVSFLLMFVLMNFLVVPRYERTQGKRKEVITAEIETARIANEEAKASLAATDKALGEARAKAQAEVNEMLARVAEESNERQTSQERELLRKLHRAEEDIAVSRAVAFEQVRSVAEDLANAIVEKILDGKKGAKA
ncbi:MAG: hypothetical protein PHW76_10430 [Alphaproteobacteria bacterium]|nr:hypothetical protein [Alphaproteobacteria bacterium]